MNIGNVNSAMMAAYQYANKTQKNNTAKTGSTGFLSAVSARQAERTESADLKDMWQARFPGAYYHTMDASNIPMSIWCRNDYPFEKFFQNDVDESILNWKPNGADPAMDSSGVQSRLHSIVGQKSIVVPPELEEKMKNNPALAQQVMAKVENFIAVNQVPGRICSHLIILDANGEIARSRASSHGGNFTGPSEAEMRQFEAEQAAKRKRRAKYMQILEESALERSEQARLHQEYYRNKSITKAIENI